MPVQSQNPDGSWFKARPLEPAPGYDTEVHRCRGVCGRWHWKLYRDGLTCVAQGRARTRFGVRLAVAVAKRLDVWSQFLDDRTEHRMRGR